MSYAYCMRKAAVVKSRRVMYSEETRAALVDAATTLFIDRGFTRTSLADIATDAQVTRGAVYHHFTDKSALFEAVLERFEAEALERVSAAAAQGSDAWDAAVRALDAFLDHCCDETYGQVVWREGPLALGWIRWRECAQQFGGFGLTREALRALMDAGNIAAGPLETLTRLVYAMIGEAGLALAEAAPADKQAVRDEFGALLLRVLEGMRIDR
jgi:AcrR family transcriptional regulator